MDAELSAYSALDKLVHKIAFAHPGVQMLAADIEKRLFGARFEKTSAARPVFIASLPRAGTTVLLEAFSRLPGVATHLYRDMPFVMAPVLWSLMSKWFQKDAKLNERAHGDGLEIGFDSPEAFEEVVWRTFWPDKYQECYIDLWTEKDITTESARFLVEHSKKIIAVRGPGTATTQRYVSKNNGNIARLEVLAKVFENACIVVPVRHPADHAASMLNQHRNFLDKHRTDSFVRRYMEDIGHYEFGLLHRPIRFPKADLLLKGLSPDDLNYWLAYWVAGFDYVRQHRDLVRTLAYENLCRDGEKVMEKLCLELGVADPTQLTDVRGMFRAPTRHVRKESEFDLELLERAETLYEELCEEWLGTS